MTLIIHLSIVLIVFMIAYFFDNRVRKNIHDYNLSLAVLNAKKDFNANNEKFEDNVNKNCQTIVDMNIFRYGIVGSLDYDINTQSVYRLVGKQTNIGNGVVMEKKMVTRDQIVEDIAKFYEKNKKPFIADSDEIRDRYMVTMYVQENMSQFVWDDKDLHDNVVVGDKISVSYDKTGPLSVGYKVKGAKNDRDTQGKVDMGKPQTNA